MSVNKVILVGNLGKDTELRYTPSGTAVVTFSIATTEKFKDREGNRQEKTEWHNIVAWRQLAEICGKWLKKGSQVYCEGKIQARSYDDRDGVKKYITEIVIHEMKMLGAEPDNGQGSSHGSQQNGNQSAQDGRSQPQAGQSGHNQGHGQQGGFSEPVYNDDDEIPF